MVLNAKFLEKFALLLVFVYNEGVSLNVSSYTGKK